MTTSENICVFRPTTHNALPAPELEMNGSMRSNKKAYTNIQKHHTRQVSIYLYTIHRVENGEERYSSSFFFVCLEKSFGTSPYGMNEARRRLLCWSAQSNAINGRQSTYMLCVECLFGQWLGTNAPE